MLSQPVLEFVFALLAHERESRRMDLGALRAHSIQALYILDVLLDDQRQLVRKTLSSGTASAGARDKRHD